MRPMFKAIQATWIIITATTLLLGVYSDNYLSESLMDTGLLGLIFFPLTVIAEWAAEIISKVFSKFTRKTKTKAQIRKELVDLYKEEK